MEYSYSEASHLLVNFVFSPGERRSVEVVILSIVPRLFFRTCRIGLQDTGSVIYFVILKQLIQLQQFCLVLLCFQKEVALLSGETFFRFWPVIVPSDISAISFVKLAPSPGWICFVTSSTESSQKLINNHRISEITSLIIIQGVPGGMCQTSGGCSFC